MSIKFMQYNISFYSYLYGFLKHNLLYCTGLTESYDKIFQTNNFSWILK